jgi:hypothetical protein
VVISLAPAGSFPRSLAMSIKGGIAKGKAPSAKQLACFDRIEAEVSNAS